MSRSTLYFVIAILAAAVVAIGAYVAYQETHKPTLEIKVDKGGISING